MLKTEREKRICAKYSAPDEDGYAHCCECPLTVDTDSTDIGCKAWMHYDRHLRDWVPDPYNGDDDNEVYTHFVHGGISYCVNCGKAIDWDHVEDWMG